MQLGTQTVLVFAPTRHRALKLDRKQAAHLQAKPPQDHAAAWNALWPQDGDIDKAKGAFGAVTLTWRSLKPEAVAQVEAQKKQQYKPKDRFRPCEENKPLRFIKKSKV
jgi:hypothetical protein